MFDAKRWRFLGSALVAILAASPALAQAPGAPTPGIASSGLRTVGQPVQQSPVYSGSFDSQGSIEAPCSACGGPTPCDTCSGDPFWVHRSGIFADYLFLRAGNVDIDYAQPVDGTASSAVPTGPLGVADPGHESGFRVGFDICIDDESSFRATYHFFESDTSASIRPPAGDVIRALTTHPNTLNAFADSNAASARYDIDFQIVDLEYRHLLAGGCDYAINYFVGTRYASLDQNFRGTYLINGVTTVDTDIDFEGVGPRIGLDGERRLKHGFLAYTSGAANFLVGEFRADYSQNNVFAGNQATTAFDDDRIVPVLEFEVGVGWENCSGCFSVRAGYYIAGWYNTLTTPIFIDSVQAGNFSDADADEVLTFDGLTVRAEWKF